MNGDYTSPGTVQVRIDDDRLEVWNPGMLPDGLTTEDLVRDHRSQPRNLRLADAFHRARLIERWGTGTLRITEACQAAGAPAAEFVNGNQTFIVRLRPQTGEAAIIADESALNLRQRRALVHVREHGHITTLEYEVMNDVAKRVAQFDLQDLVRCGALTMTGKGRLTRYESPR